MSHETTLGQAVNNETSSKNINCQAALWLMNQINSRFAFSPLSSSDMAASSSASRCCFLISLASSCFRISSLFWTSLASQVSSGPCNQKHCGTRFIGCSQWELVPFYKHLHHVSLHSFETTCQHRKCSQNSCVGHGERSNVLSRKF